MNYKKILLSAVGSFSEAFFPTKCLACGSFFNLSEKLNARRRKTLKSISDLSWQNQISRFFCGKCTDGFTKVESPFCLQCGIMFESRSGENHLCGRCIKSPGAFRTARSAGLYEGALMEAIHCLKYKGKLQLSEPLGALLCSVFMRHWDKGCIDMMIPVPLHIKRFRKRGFNQSYLLAASCKKIASVFNFGVSDLKICKDVLYRKKPTHQQTGLDREKRIDNMKNAFGLKNPSEIRGKKILLVDDVFTTGATANSCAKALIKGGAAYVDVLTLAQTL